MMDKSALDNACQKIYQKFPTLQNKRPKVLKQGESHYLLVFSSSGKTPDGKTLEQKVRVVTDLNGRIIKTSMSK
jgi:hypothetical protein